MGKPKTEKELRDRLSEGISLLNQLRNAGVKDTCISFMVLQQQISIWVKEGTAWEGTIDFPEYRRVAVVNLPKYNNRAADLVLKHKPFTVGH